MENQVRNLETRLTESGATDEPARSGIEKFFNVPAGQVWWMDVFDVIDRPLRAAKYGIRDGSFKEAWEAFKGNRAFMAGSDFLVSINAVSADDIAGNPGMKLMLDIGFDVFADPLNYIAPVKLLKKLGVLSDTKTISKLDEIIKVQRVDGLITLTDDALNASVIAARNAAEEALKQAGKNADEIATILAKTVDEWDDVAKAAYNTSLKNAGVLDDAGFRTMLDKFGQTIDDQGRVVFKPGAIDDARAATKQIDDLLKEFRTLRGVKKGIKNAAPAVRQLRRFADDATRAADDALRAQNTLVSDFAKANKINKSQAKQALIVGGRGTTPELVQQYAKLTSDINNSKALVQKYTKLADDLARADELYKTARAKIKAGEEAEVATTNKLRDLLQKQSDRVFGDANVMVVKGDTRGTADDLVMWIKKQDGSYMQLKNADGSMFKFEIKDPEKFSILNSNLKNLSKEKLAGTADELRNLKAELAAKGKDFTKSKKYQNLYNQWLEDVQIYRASGGNPGFHISATGDIMKKYGKETVDEFSKLLRNVVDDVSKGKYEMSDFFRLLDDYYRKADEFMAGGMSSKKALDEARKIVYTDEVFKNTGISGATLTAKGKAAEDAAREFLKMKQMVDPSNAYGAIRKLADGTEELVILTPDDFFKRAKFDSFSIESTGRSSGTKQSKVALYMGLDLSDIDDVTVNNSWFKKALTEGTPEVTDKVLRQTQEYRAGLIVRMLNGVGKSRIPFIAPAADLVAKAVDGLTFLFNSTKGLGDDLTEQLAKIPAEDLQAAKVSVAKVENLISDIVTATKGKYSDDFVRSTISQLLDEGWDGVSIAGRRMEFGETVKRWAAQYRKAGKAQFVDFATELDFNNFKNVLNRLLRAEGKADDFIKLRRVNGATIVDFADGVTAKELDEFVNALSPTTAQQSIDLGKANLTSEQLVFAKEFNETIMKIVDESVAQQNMLRRLGFDFKQGTLGSGAYFRHAINPQMLKFIQGKSPASIKKFLDAGTDMLRDRIYIGSISEINAGVRELFGINVNLFSTDAAFNFADLVRVAATKNEMDKVLRAMLTSQDTLGRELFEVIDDLEYTARGMKGNFQILNNSFKAEFPNLFKNLSDDAQSVLLKYFADKGFAEGSKVIAVQKSAYGVLKRLDNAYVVLPEFIQGYDQFMKFWKTFALITPGYHMRNFFGNITNSFMAGMPIFDQSRYLFRTSSDFTQYRKVLRALQRGEDVSKLGDNVIEAFKRVDDYFRSGASQSHRGVKDLEIIKEGIRIAKGQERTVAQKIGDALLNFNYKSAEMMDDMQRYSLYRWAFDKAENSARVRSAKAVGASTSEITALKRSEAYRKVSEALFDYSHLTPFEQEYMKRLFPFYTFMKNNLIFQAKSLFERPQQYGKLYRTYKYYTEDMTGMDLEDLPNYMTDNLWVPMPYRVNKGDAEAIEWLRLNLPPSDFTEFVENPFARGVTSLTVPIKFFIEMGTNRDLFTGQQIREFPGQTSTYQEEGFLSNLRDERGRFTLSTNPYTIKFLNDIGFRSLFSYGTAAIDLIDYQQGNITREEMTRKLADALGLTRAQTLDDLQIASLYQNLDKARDLKDLYEQENDGRLPTLAELAALTQQEEQKPQGGIFDNLFG